ncbi:hypothetical protein [Acinetobacter pragensis]|uniref:Uncharacterized protein n=1 Tax=Acinetobacter pragensis TaxID=1806892 RepID=A0A151Y6D8_9GAMM|nr:hypothetical protein [Acinetobacter pragensis]KYQ73593.1 hypothetical protein AZH43_00280 [Acinetobacter pragensis]
MDIEIRRLFEYKIDRKKGLLNYDKDEEIVEYCKKEFSCFFGEFLLQNSNKYNEIIAVIVDLYFIELDYYEYLGKCSRDRILNNYLYNDIVKIYEEKNIKIIEEDSEFYKYKINSINENFSIVCNQANKYLVDKRLDINFCLSIRRFLLETLSYYYKKGVIENLAFRVDGVRKGFLIFDSIDRGAKLKNEISTLPKVSKFFDLNNYENALWIQHNRLKRHLIFEEICDDFELLNENIVTQLVHLEYFIENDQYFISHLDHEYIVYSLDEYSERLKNSNVKGHRKVKTFKIDNSRIPFFDKFKNEYFLFIVLNSYFNHKELLKEYFETVSDFV